MKFFPRPSVVLLSLFFLSGFLNAQAESEGQNIPELPAKESAYEADENDFATGPRVINYDDQAYSSGFFSDTSVNSGHSRYLNALELSGYLRFRLAYFRNPHLGTYIPELGRGTSNFAPNLSIYNDTSGNENNPDQNHFSGNMRLRLNPTIHVSENIRVKTSLDIFDNMVLGSTPAYMSMNSFNPSVPVSMMSMSQNAPVPGVNSWQSAIMVKRVWGEASFPFGELRFGRMPMHWGLGLLYNSGDELDADYSDQVDGISFNTKFFDHHFSPGYFIAYSGPHARGGGFYASAPNFPNYYLPLEGGQSYPLETGDLTHVLTLSFLKKHSDYMIQQKIAEHKAIFNYGLFTSYRTQNLDSQNVSTTPDAGNLPRLVKRNGNVGLASLWSSLAFGTLHIEMELAGILGKYTIGEKSSDLLASNNGGTPLSERDIWLLQGGFAVETKYGFLSDRLQVGLDAGLASSHSGPGYGLREGSVDNPSTGMGDGRKNVQGNEYKTNFKFNPGYTVDYLMFKEVLGGISGSYYFKPHLAYFFNRNLGVRSDVITSFAVNKENTTGNSNLLGVEIDASAFFRTESGFYLSLGYGVLFPLRGLSHQKSTEISNQNMAIFGDAKVAQTLQTFIGLSF